MSSATRRSSWALAALVAYFAFACAGGAVTKPEIRIVKIHYRAHSGTERNAYVVLPAWYGPRNAPPIPLIISPHGRGLSGRANARIWGNLPAVGPFAVVNPDGQGRLLPSYSWGSAGQIEDLSRMPEILRRTVPWLHVERSKVYAFGGSIGGQETLLLVARHPRLFAGAAVFDSVADLARQYREFPHLVCDSECRKIWDGPLGKSLQQLARREIGGSPGSAPGAYARRSPVTYARRLAYSCVPLQFWWSDADRIVIGQQEQSGRLFRTIRELNPDAPVQAFVGFWIHTAEMNARTRLPLALATFGLLPPDYEQRTPALHVDPPPVSDGCDPVP